MSDSSFRDFSVIAKALPFHVGVIVSGYPILRIMTKETQLCIDVNTGVAVLSYNMQAHCYIASLCHITFQSMPHHSSL